MQKPKDSEWWATPPKIVGPLVIVVVLATIVIGAFMGFTGKIQEAMLIVMAGIFFLLIALIDLVAELIRFATLIADSKEEQGALSDL